MPPRNTVPAEDQSGTTQPTEGETPVVETEIENPAAVPDQRDEVIRAYQEQLLAETRGRQNLERQLAEARKPAPEAPTVRSAEDEKQFYDKPITSIAETVRSEVARSVAPVNQFIANMQRNELIAAIKTQMRNTPAQFPYISLVEPIFDSILANEPVIDIPKAVSAYNTAIGYHVSNGGKLEVSNNNAPVAPINRGNQPVSPLPPHARPSAPASSTPAGGKKIRALTEAEKKIARFNKMTDIEYIIHTDNLSPAEVATISDDELKARMK